MSRLAVSRFAACLWIDLETAARSSKQAIEISTENEVRLEALDGCVAQLNEQDRKLLSERYNEDVAVSDIAKRSSRTRGAVYKVLTRIHRDLLACVEHKLAREGVV